MKIWVTVRNQTIEIPCPRQPRKRREIAHVNVALLIAATGVSAAATEGLTGG